MNKHLENKLKNTGVVYFCALSLAYFAMFANKASDGVDLSKSVTLLIPISAFAFFIIKDINKKINYFLSHFFLLVSLYIANGALVVSNHIAEVKGNEFEARGVKWDHRSKAQVVSDMRVSQNRQNIYPHTNTGGLVQANMLRDNIDLHRILQKQDFKFPLSNISASTIIHCNEYGVWKSFNSDEFGFNNPSDIIDKESNHNISIHGDSFAEGFCVSQGQDFASALRGEGFDVMNLGKAGGGVIHARAIYREFNKPREDFKSDVVVFLLFSQNDLNDTFAEFSTNFYDDYLKSDEYSQDLINKQAKVDQFLEMYYELLLNPSFIDKNPALQKYGQTIVTTRKPPKLFTVENLKSFVLFVPIRDLFSSMKKTTLIPEERLNNLISQISNFRDEVERSSQFIVVYLPAFEELSTKDISLSAKVVEQLKSIGVEVINMHPIFSEKDLSELFYYGLPGHYTHFGYQILADTVAKRVQAIR